MASSDQYPDSKEEDENVPKTANTSSRHFQHQPMSPMISQQTIYLRSENGSDEADRRLEHSGNVRPQQERWMQSSIFSEPKMLIFTDTSGEFAICDETLMQISSITWKLVIVGIAGPYRCGKSFMMNRLVGKSKGFFVGNTTEAATKGIWAWCKIHPKQEKTVLLLLDTEGLGDIEKGDTYHDNKLLTLITLLVNVLVFNLMGRFDEDSMMKLSFATQISEKVNFGCDPKNREKLRIVMPEFVLCLRDFYLKFRDGIDSPDMYFEQCLKDVEGKKEYNAPRQSLKNYFPTRNCFTFPLPADEETMDNLENADETQLSKSFLKKTDQFSQHIFSCEPKVMYDSNLSVHAYIDGPIFKSLLEYHVDCTRKGIIPDIENAFLTASRKENEKIMQEVKDEFMKTIDSIPLPVNTIKDVQDIVLTDMTKCLKMFRERMKLDKDNIQEKQLQSDFQQILDDMKTENSKLLQQQFAENLMKIYRDTIKVTISDFAKENGYLEYQKKLNQMKLDFKSGLDQSLLSEFTLAWSEFRNRIHDDEMDILENDGIVTKEKREREIEKLKEDNEKAMEKLVDEKRLLMEATKARLQNEQKKRDEAHKKELQKIVRKLSSVRNLNFWGRMKFLFKGTLDDD